MKGRGILFSAPMVRAILAGTKTQTRRAVKRPERYVGGLHNCAHCCPYGVPGDRLWVRETARCISWSELPLANLGRVDIDYKADDHSERCGRSVEYTLDKPLKVFPSHSARADGAIRWQPAIHMPRWASRLTLEVTGVRVERLQDISEADALAEGVERVIIGDGWRRYSDAASEAAGLHPCANARDSYASLWESINGPGSWDANPWVWVVEFRRSSADASQAREQDQQTAQAAGSTQTCGPANAAVQPPANKGARKP